MESINVVIDDEEVEAPSNGEENQLNSTKLPMTSVDAVKTSPGMSLTESLSIPTTSDTIASASEDVDNLANPPKWSWVKLNHPP